MFSPPRSKLSPVITASRADQRATPRGWSIGQLAWIAGTSRKDLNGRVGTVVAVDSERDRVHVTLSDQTLPDATPSSTRGPPTAPVQAAGEPAPAVATGSGEAEEPPTHVATKVMFFNEGLEQHRPFLVEAGAPERATGFVFTGLRTDRTPQRIDAGGGKGKRGESREACGAREMLKKFDLGEAWTHETLEAKLQQAPLEMFWYGETRISLYRVGCALDEEWGLTAAGEEGMCNAR